MARAPRPVLAIGAALAWLLTLPAGAGGQAARPFTIQVVDDQTGRGVPLVELRTVNNVSFFTDSAGVTAFREPGLLGRKVFFNVSSHGYEYPKDGFGIRGTALETEAGGKAVLKVHRLNVAERLYRLTGQGIYADSIECGLPVPVREPLLNGQVLGQDSVQNAVYHGRLFWLWGDTLRPSYPLGNFNMSGATSALPVDGGLDPSRGVDLTYFVDETGFARGMAPVPGEGPTWLGGVVVLRDPSGKERMLASYSKIRNQLETYEQGLVEYDDERQRFDAVARFPLDMPAFPTGHPFLRGDGARQYVYYCAPYPLIRAPADAKKLRDPHAYEAYTPLSEGTRPPEGRVARDRNGAVRYAWRHDSPALNPADQEKLVREGKLKPEEALLHLRDLETGDTVTAHGGSVNWNAYRKRWILIAVQIHGTSNLGEVWYAEADTPLGPWVYARKIVTHNRYDFYNPKQHPYFDQEGGRLVYFEGTYVNTFSGNPVATPRYDYNQVMYRLDLSDARLNLPVAVYEPGGEIGTCRHLGPKCSGKPPAFFALERPRPAAVPVYELREGERTRLSLQAPASGAADPLFYALPAESEPKAAGSVPLYERATNTAPRYTTDPASVPEAGGQRPSPLCRVWRSPTQIGLPYP